MSGRMNFVIFMPDEMRAESLGCYGHPIVKTPHIDRLAAEGTRFDQCHVQHTVCSPSRCSMVTGWYAHVNGHRTLWHLLRPHEPNLFRYLREAGYDVRWFGKNDLLAPECFPFSVTEARPVGKAMFGPRIGNKGEPISMSFLYEPFAAAIETHGDYRMIQAAIDYLEGRPEQPFCIYMPLSSPHPPYSAPLPWHNMYSPADLPPLRPADLPGKPRCYQSIRRTRQLSELPDEVFRQINAVYLGMISFTDYMLGRILQALDSTGYAQNTTVLLLSDHGDWAGDFGLVEKWPSALDDTLTRVPLIVRTPGGKAGHVVNEPVELFDIMPTCLDLAEVPCRHTHFASSLVEQLHGAAGDAKRAVYAEGGYDRHEPHCFEGRPSDAVCRDEDSIYYPKGKLQQDEPESVCRSVMVRTATHKLIRRTSDVNELYDLRRDPQELHNLYGDPAYAAVQSQLEGRLLEWYIATADQVPWDENPRGLPPRR